MCVSRTIRRDYEQVPGLPEHGPEGRPIHSGRWCNGISEEYTERGQTVMKTDVHHSRL